MESIEADYETLRGVLPKAEYQELDNEVLGRLLRTLNPEELKKASGDIFGRIYEYFLTQFADQKAHDGGEFFTPISLVSLIANVLEPGRGVVLDPACGSGGMFVQSAHFVEHLQANPSERLTFYGLEKNPTTIRLAKMNLAVHGLEGDIQKAITYYEDPHELLGKADFVLANPPFNVDEVDEEKVKRDPRLPFGLPGVNKNKKVSNGNYLWISYFYSYLNETGRAGFVMSSQASSAGRDEAKVRQKLIETGDVDIMIAVRSNFFYTRTVPCELWFLNRNKPEAHRDQVLMLDARNIYRKVTRKIYDFSPEQRQNLLAIVWLYRGQNDRFLDLVAHYLGQTLEEAGACFETEDEAGRTIHPLADYQTALAELKKAVQPFLDTLPGGAAHAEVLQQFEEGCQTFEEDVDAFLDAVVVEATHWEEQTQRVSKKSTSVISNGAERREKSVKSAIPAQTDFSPSARNDTYKTPSQTHPFGKGGQEDSLCDQFVKKLAPLAETSRDLVRQADLIYKLACRLIDVCEGELAARESDLWVGREITRARKAADEARQIAVEQLKRVRYFHKQAVWLTERFPDAVLRDVEGLVKLVDRSGIGSQRLEPHPRPLRRRCPGGRG